MLYIVYVYCPLCPRFDEFSLRVEAPTEELARKKAVGKTVTCKRAGHSFEVEDQFITRVYPAKTVTPPSYKLMPEEKVKEATWLRGSIVEEPLPLAAKPKGSPKLATVIKNGLTTLIYSQPVESKAIQFLKLHVETRCRVCKYVTPHRADKCPRCNSTNVEVRTYSPGDVVHYTPLKRAETLIDEGIARWAYPHPEYKWGISYPRHIFTKFYEQARRMARTRKICEAAEYLVTYCPGITVRMIADITSKGYWTVYRCIAPLVSPEQLEKLGVEVTEQGKLEKWMPKELEEIKRQIELEKTVPKLPKIVLGPKWRGQYTCYPFLHKTEEELLTELKKILTLEGYPTLTPEEEAEMKRHLRRDREEKLRESIMYYLGGEE